MEEKEIANNNGIELILNATYVFIIVLSYFLIVNMFNTISKVDNIDYGPTYVNCFILVVPCVIDGVKELLNYTKKQKIAINIIDIIFGVLSCLLAVSLLFAIFTNNNKSIFAQIMVYSSILCSCSYFAHFTSAFVELCKLKFGKREGK